MTTLVIVFFVYGGVESVPKFFSDKYYWNLLEDNCIRDAEHNKLKPKSVEQNLVKKLHAETEKYSKMSSELKESLIMEADNYEIISSEGGTLLAIKAR